MALTMTLTYVALIHKADVEKADYGVMIPDFPGCVFGGRTVDAAIENATEGLIFQIEGLMNEGETLPEPTSLQKIVATLENKEAIPCLIRLIPPVGELKRVNISIDSGLLAAIDQAAAALHKNRSEFLSDAARRILA
jgi:predicted RNase H-like HicB family nuclease